MATTLNEKKRERKEAIEMKKEKSREDGKKSGGKSPTNGTRIRWAINPKIILCSSCRRVPVSAWWVSAIVRTYDWPAGVQRLINFKKHLLIIKLFQTRANVETHSDVIIVCKNLPPLPFSPYFSSRVLLTLLLLLYYLHTYTRYNKVKLFQRGLTSYHLKDIQE